MAGKPPDKLDYQASLPPRKKGEPRPAARFCGLMFMGVAVFDAAFSIPYGLNPLAILIGILGLTLFLCAL